MFYLSKYFEGILRGGTLRGWLQDGIVMFHNFPQKWPFWTMFGRFVAINFVARHSVVGWLIVKSGEEGFLCCASG